MKTILITGANRGIGLAFVKHYLTQGDHIIACCRQPESAQALQDLQTSHPKQLDLYNLDITQPEQISQLQAQLSCKPIDILINNAGIYGDTPVQVGQFSVDNFQKTFLTNAVSPLKLTEALLDNIASSHEKKVVIISSKMGSIDDCQSGRSYAYRASKVAANMLFKTLSIEVADRGISVGIFHPGWVKTDMGGANALITPEQSVDGITHTIDQLTAQNSGCFFNYDGSIIPW